MTKLTPSVLLALGALVALAPAPSARAQDGGAVRADKRPPGEVAAFLRRRAGCNRLADADADDPERVTEAVRWRGQLKCRTLADDERRLRARYADTPRVIDALDRAGDTDDGDN